MILVVCIDSEGLINVSLLNSQRHVGYVIGIPGTSTMYTVMIIAIWHDTVVALQWYTYVGYCTGTTLDRPLLSTIHIYMYSEYKVTQSRGR